MDSGLTSRRSVAAEILVPVAVYFAVSRLWHSQLAGLIVSGGSAAVLALIPVLRRREFRTLPVVMAVAAVAGLAVSALAHRTAWSGPEPSRACRTRFSAGSAVNIEAMNTSPSGTPR